MTTPDATGLVKVAAALLAEGRSAYAAELYAYLYAVDPENAAIAKSAVVAASQAGDHVGALGCLVELTQRNFPVEDITLLIRQVGLAAIRTFNERQAAGDLATAGPIIDGLAALLPHKYVSPALNVARSLGNQGRMLQYAAELLRQDPTHWLAHAALADVAMARGNRKSQLRHQSLSVLNRPRTPPEEDRLFSAEAMYMISEMLIGAPDPEWPPLINALRAGVAACPEQFTTESQRELDRYMRVSLETMDPGMLESRISTEAPPVPKLAVADSFGVSLTLAQLPERVRAGAPQTVLLAAADEVYLRRYGRNYIDSILQRADVGCTILLCMVGQAARLKDVIDAIGVHDPRVFYLVDEFDPARAATYYTRTGPLTDCARAYYQSVRFLVLEHLLHALDLPVIVTDIDISLQGSLAGLLQRHRNTGVVLNRNEVTVSYGSYFTANLLLVRPGPTGYQLARQLRILLQRVLPRAHIEQFIDQSMLVLACYGCRNLGLEDFGYFAPDDINNVMFNKTGMGGAVMDLARSFVFLAYYGSEGDSAVELMKAANSGG